jgi:hypothetical protein
MEQTKLTEKEAAGVPNRDHYASATTGTAAQGYDPATSYAGPMDTSAGQPVGDAGAGLWVDSTLLRPALDQDQTFAGIRSPIEGSSKET